MKRNRISGLRRRNFLVTVAATPWILATAGLTPTKVMAATPSCGHGVTPPQTSGPFLKPDSPHRTSLIEPGAQGERINVTGRVLSTSCQPVSGALIDFWHCDASGNYDNRGYRFRCHQFSDAQGAFTLDTLMPGVYPGRTRHIHVIVQAPNRRPLTTQLYFPGEALNEGDWIFDPRLLMKISPDGARIGAQFDFVLDLG